MHSTDITVILIIFRNEFGFKSHILIPSRGFERVPIEDIESKSGPESDVVSVVCRNRIREMEGELWRG